MAFGITPEGFVLKRLDDIVTEIKEDLRSTIDPNLDLSANTPEGQISGILADRLSSIWEAVQAAYYASYPETSEGINLDNVVAITGLTRLPAIKSDAIITITGTPSTLVSSGFVVSVAGNPSILFETISDYTIGVGGTVDATVYSQVAGEISALAGSLTEIETPVSGVDSVTNALDANIGENIESDPDLKIRQKERLQRSGTGTLEGIRNTVLNIEDVQQAIVIENTTLVTDAGGRPGKSFETIVQGGVQADIAQAIFNTKPVGIETYGLITESISDSQGISHDIKFSRPTEVDIYVIVNITKNTDPIEGDVYPADGDTQIENNILAFADDFLIGQDVLRDGSKGLSVPINNVQGIRVAEILFGIAVTPTTSTPVSIDIDELALFDSTRITVNS